MRRVISLYLPTWPTDLVRRHTNAPASDEPLVTVVTEGSRRLISAVDHNAHALGLRTGQAVTHASAVVPRLHVVEATPDQDWMALNALARWCIDYSPVVALCPPDGVWIDIAGASHLFGSEKQLIADLLQRLNRQGIHALASVADTQGAAWAMVRYGQQIIVPPGEASRAVETLPVAGLRLSPQIIESLHLLGIERIGQVACMPRAPIARRFGKEFLLRLDQLYGQAVEPLDPLVPKEMPSRRLIFPEPISQAESLQDVLSQLTIALCRDLAQQDLGVRRLDLFLARVDRHSVSLRIGTAKATREVCHLTKLFDERLQTVDPGFGIEAAILVASKVEPLSAHQVEARDLKNDEITTVDLSRLVDRLAARLGDRRIYRLQPVESHVPERTVKRVAALAPISEQAWLGTTPRPARLLEYPEPITATALLPDHPPAFFVWRRIRHCVIKADGPERIRGEWWWRSAGDGDRENNDFALRDYYRVENETGARFWIFRDMQGNQAARWWLHGVFA